MKDTMMRMLGAQEDARARQRARARGYSEDYIVKVIGQVPAES